MKISFKQYYFRWSKNLFFLFLFFMALMSLARGLFALYFADLATLTHDLAELRSALILGVRFDLMPVAYVTAIPFLILNLAYIFPGKITIRAARFIIVSVLFVGFMALGWVYVCDYAFFSYFQDHINILFFGLFEDDTVAVLISIWKNYNLPVWLTFIIFLHYVFYRFVHFLFSAYEFDLRVKKFDWRFPAFFIFGSVFIAYGARGNFGRLPLSIEDAHISTNEFINKLSLNGALCLNRTIKIRRTFGRGSYDYLGQYNYRTWQDAFKDMRGVAPRSRDLKASLRAKTPINPALEARPLHVVIVVMESFGSFWNEQDGKDFEILGKLNDHFKEGTTFPNFLPAENGTIGSMVSVATSQVIRPGARFLSESEFMNTPLSTAGHLPYKSKGYDTHFVYGGKLGWRDLGKFLKVQGLDNFWGADEIKEAMPELQNISEHDLGNEWGIFDEYLYTFIEEQLRTAVRPQFFIVLTTSNHPPFEYPTSYNPLPVVLTSEMKEKFTVREDLAMKRFLGLQYANNKIGEFLTRIKSSTDKDRIVVALTGDHSFWIAKGVGHEEEFKRYSVPFFISAPSHVIAPGKVSRAFGSHEDIFPTLFHLTLSNQEYVKLGENMLGEPSFAMNSTGLVANEHGAYHHGKYWRWMDLEKQILGPAEETPELLKLKKYREGMISITDLLLKKEKSRKRTDAKNDLQ